MDKAIEKFELILEEFYFKTKIEISRIHPKGMYIENGVLKQNSQNYDKKKLQDFEDMASLLKSFIEYIKIPRYRWNIVNVIFSDFINMSLYLKESKMTSREKFNVVSYFINRNILSNIEELSDETICFDAVKLADFKFKTITKEEIKDLLKDQKIMDLLTDKDNLTEKEREQVDEILANKDHYLIDYRDIQKICVNYKEYILDKMPNITIQDIVEAVNCYQKLGVEESVIENIKSYLLNVFLKNIEHADLFDIELNDIYIDMLVKDDANNTFYKNVIRNHNKNKSKEHKVVDNVVKEQKEYLSNNDVKKMIGLIKQYYDINKKRIISFPSINELEDIIKYLDLLEYDTNSFLNALVDKYLDPEFKIIINNEYFISLLKVLIQNKISKEKIILLIQAHNKKVKISNSFVTFIYNSEIIKYYDESLFNDLNELFSSFFITDDVNYAALKELFDEYMNEFFHNHNEKVDYELSLINKNN